jgi:hypothetical protein
MKKFLIFTLFGLVSIISARADIITASSFGVPTGDGSTSYGTFNTSTFESGAAYNGCMSSNPTNTGTIQMRWKDNSPSLSAGIVSTTSGGKVAGVTIKWNSATSSTRSIAIYGSHTAYTSWENLTASSTEGTLIATVAIADAQDNVSVVNCNGEYEYIGLHSTSGAVYLDQIEILWNNGGEQLQDPKVSYGVEEVTVRLGEEMDLPTLTWYSNATPSYSSSDTSIATVSQDGTVTPLAAGTCTISAQVPAIDNYMAGSASYKLIVLPANVVVEPGNTDIITAATFGIPVGSDTSYGVFDSSSLSSGATYEVCANKTPAYNNTIQMRWKDNTPSLSAGLVSLTSGGKAKTLTIKWNSATSSTRSIAIYGSHTAYTSWENLTASSTEGTLIATVAIADAQDNVSVVNCNGEYEYIGLHSTSGAVYLDEVDIEWNQESSGIECISVESEASTSFFDLQGREVKNPSAGIYICKKGTKVEKVIIR